MSIVNRAARTARGLMRIFRREHVHCENITVI